MGAPGEQPKNTLTLTFLRDNFDKLQTIKFTGQDDDVDDGDRTIPIVLQPRLTYRDRQNNVRIMKTANTTILITNTNDDQAELIMRRSDGALLELDERGTIGSTFAVELGSQPIDTVTVPLTVSLDTEGRVNPPELTFTPLNWNQKQMLCTVRR